MQNIKLDYALYRGPWDIIYLKQDGAIYRWIKQNKGWLWEDPREWVGGLIPYEQWEEINRLTFLIRTGKDIEQVRWYA